MQFDQKVVVVTGAAQGIGRACAESFAAAGAGVALLDVAADRAVAAARELTRAGPARHVGVECDVRVAARVERAFAEVLERFGRIDIVVNNAGVGDASRTEELTEAAWDLVVDTCLKGTFLCSQQAARAMTAGSGGVIVNVASMLGVTFFPNRAAYCSAKAGVIALTKVTAGEWASLGIRVNAVAPGYVDTDAVRAATEQGVFQPEMITGRTPLARMGTPAEVASAVRYLASDDASFVTGHTLVIDGGYTSYGAWWPPRPRR